MMKRTLTIACALAAMAGAWAQGSGSGGAANAPTKGPSTKGDSAKAGAGSVTIPLSQQNGSGENGTVTLTPEGDKTRITIKLTGAPAGVAQPAHVHDGACEKIDPKPKYPLPNVVDGAANGTVAAKMDSLLDGKHAVNVHKSAAELQTYVACATLAKRAGGSGN